MPRSFLFGSYALDPRGSQPDSLKVTRPQTVVGVQFGNTEITKVAWLCVALFLSTVLWLLTRIQFRRVKRGCRSNGWSMLSINGIFGMLPSDAAHSQSKRWDISHKIYYWPFSSFCFHSDLFKVTFASSILPFSCPNYSCALESAESIITKRTVVD